MLVFPEGTCTNQKAIITFKNGSFHPGVNVQPVVVKYRWKYMDPSFPAISPKILKLAVRTMCQFYNSMEVRERLIDNSIDMARLSTMNVDFREQCLRHCLIAVPCVFTVTTAVDADPVPRCVRAF